MIFKVRFEKKGAHIHCDLFSSPMYNSTWKMCGSFCIREEEFTALQLSMGGVGFESKVKAERREHVEAGRRGTDIS